MIMNVGAVPDIDQKFKDILKSNSKGQMQAVLDKCDSDEKDTLIMMLVIRLNGGMLHE